MVDRNFEMRRLPAAMRFPSRKPGAPPVDNTLLDGELVEDADPDGKSSQRLRYLAYDACCVCGARCTARTLTRTLSLSPTLSPPSPCPLPLPSPSPHPLTRRVLHGRAPHAPADAWGGGARTAIRLGRAAAAAAEEADDSWAAGYLALRRGPVHGGAQGHVLGAAAAALIFARASAAALVAAHGEEGASSSSRSRTRCAS